MKDKHIKSFNEHQDNDIESRIIEVLGMHHKNPIQFYDALHSEPYGLYTYKGNVHIIKAGEEWDFSDLTDKEKKILTDRFNNNQWKINKALQ